MSVDNVHESVEQTKFAEIESNLRVLFQAYTSLQQNNNKLETTLTEKVEGIKAQFEELQNCITSKVFNELFLENIIDRNEKKLETYQQQLASLESEISNYGNAVDYINNLQNELDNSENSQVVIDILTDKLQELRSHLSPSRTEKDLQEELANTKALIAECERRRNMFVLL